MWTAASRRTLEELVAALCPPARGLETRECGQALNHTLPIAELALIPQAFLQSNAGFGEMFAFAMQFREIKPYGITKGDTFAFVLLLL